MIALRALVLGAIVSSSSSVWAQASSPVDEDARKQARDLYDAGVKHYNVLEYDKAIDAFKRAYLLSRTPSLLYNVAQAYRQKGAAFCGDASSFYKSYLRERANAPDRDDVDVKIREMDRCAERERAKTAAASAAEKTATSTPAPIAPGSAAASEPPPRRPTLPLWIAGGGGVLALSGGVLYGAAAIKHQSLADECPPCAPSRWRTWETLSYVSYGLLAAGGAIALGGLAWYFVQPTTRSEKATRSAFRVAVTPWGAIAGGAF